MENFLLFLSAGFGQPWVKTTDNKILSDSLYLFFRWTFGSGHSRANFCPIRSSTILRRMLCSAYSFEIDCIRYHHVIDDYELNVSQSFKLSSNYNYGWQGFRWVFTQYSHFNQDFISVLSLISIFGIYNLAIGKTAGLQNAFDGSSPNVAAYAVAFYTCMWSYGGWERVCQCFDEIKEPKRNMPIIISGNISKCKPVNEGNQL